ncbi:MAG: hypothetical protein A2Y07_02310 [Planctomycetes bacterium GWF2_50_10]|nr:MAG: hypothetical protein A2Y07_02310 [Planctomycetes bacterium GWF2_50_10]
MPSCERLRMEWLFIPLGFFVGVLGTLIGVGGGVVLVPILLLCYPHMRPEVITAISLAMIFANSLSGSAAYAWQRRINYRAGMVFAVAAVPGAIAGAFLIGYIKTRTFDVAFGLVMLIVSAYLMLRPAKDMASGVNGCDFKPTAAGLKLGALISTGVGLLSSLLGIGVGIIHVPAMIYVLGFGVHIATATSLFVLMIMSGCATAVHLFDGSLDGRGLITVFLILGVVPGAQLGAYLSRKLHSVWVVRLLAGAMAVSGVRILWMAF